MLVDIGFVPSTVSINEKGLILNNTMPLLVSISKLPGTYFTDVNMETVKLYLVRHIQAVLPWEQCLNSVKLLVSLI